MTIRLTRIKSYEATNAFVDVDVEKSRAQAYASMPASCIANYV